VDKYKDVNSQPILISPRLLLPEAGLSRIKLFTKKLIDGQGNQLLTKILKYHIFKI